MRMPDQPTRDHSVSSLDDALARLQGRWGSAAITLGNGGRPAIGAARTSTAIGAVRTSAATRVAPTASAAPTAGVGPTTAGAAPTHGALALVPEPDRDPDARPDPRIDPLAPIPDDVVSTGFPALDAVLGRGGLPREASAAIRGDPSSGKTTLALRCVAEAQGRGAIAAWLDLARAFDPVDAVARGVDLRWLLVVRPADAAEGFAVGGALLSGRAVDLLVVDLPAGLPAREESTLRRLSAHARRVGARLLVLEPPTLAGPLHGALAEVSALRLELEREGWIRLGRDVVGQTTRVTVAKNRFGPPGRHVVLGIHYADEGERSLDAHRHASATRATRPTHTTRTEEWASASRLRHVAGP